MDSIYKEIVTGCGTHTFPSLPVCRGGWQTHLDSSITQKSSKDIRRNHTPGLDGSMSLFRKYVFKALLSFCGWPCELNVASVWPLWEERCSLSVQFLFLDTHPLDYLVVPWLRIWKERKALSAQPMARFPAPGNWERFAEWLRESRGKVV